jgi:ferredoxin-NADP reductase
MARVTFEGKRYPLREGETVLSALLRGGASVPFSCKKGTCQSCMLRAVEGDPGDGGRRGLRASLARDGYFLPCSAQPAEDLVVSRPDPAALFVRMHVHAKEVLAPRIVRLLLEPETTFVWRPGQYVNVRHPSGETRSYSVASLEDDYWVEIHVQRAAGGLVSTWLADVVAVGDVLDVQGPAGECCYDASDPACPILLIGSGTGLSPLLAIARDALARGHTGEILLYHGAREASSLYMRETLGCLAEAHASFHYVPCASGAGEAAPGIVQGRAADVALARHRALDGWTVYLAGNPEMVHDVRHRAFRAGAQRERIHADPFEPKRPFMPDDAAKLATIAPDPELWRALGEGALLRAILTDFYGRVYEDPRLAPFFHKVTKERAIDKQYSFLADVFTGKKSYFGLKPFNAHHWMVISDELFDYRERLIEDTMRRHGLAERFIRRWCAVHELFRREIVKASARGLVVDGVEHLHEGFREETLDLACVCDGCGAEMPAGTTGRLHARTGELFCGRCAARKVGATSIPPAPPP